MAPLLLPRSPLAATIYTPPAAPRNRTASTHAPTSTVVAKDTPTTTAPAEISTKGTNESQAKNPKKRKRKDNEKPHILHQATFRKPTWSYFHLSLITPGTASVSRTTTTTTNSTTAPTTATTTSTPTASTSRPSSPPTTSTNSISPLTALPLLTQPLRAYLGTTGSSIPIDILQTSGRDVFVRIPRQDARGLRASLSGWIGSCEGENVPGVVDEEGGGGGGKVKVAWRVVGEGGVLGALSSGDGGEMFG